MAWWVWVLIWVALIAVAAAVLVPMILSVLRQLDEFQRELATASQRFALISQQLERLEDQHPATPEPDAGVVQRRGDRDKAIRQAKALTTMRLRARDPLGVRVGEHNG